MNVAEAAVYRMRLWADANPHADTQGLTPDELEGLARAALALTQTVDTDARVQDAWREGENA